MLSTKHYDTRIHELFRIIHQLQDEKRYEAAGKYSHEAGNIIAYAGRLGLTLWQDGDAWYFMRHGYNEQNEHTDTHFTPAYHRRRTDSARNFKQLVRHAIKEKAMSKPVKGERLPDGSAQGFAVGDRVISKHTKSPGVVDAIVVRYRVLLDYKHGMSIGAEFAAEELLPVPEKLSEEDAWLSVATLIGKRVYEFTINLYNQQDSDKETRHQAYVILGSNGIDVGRKGTQKHEAIKQRLTTMIER